MSKQCCRVCGRPLYDDPLLSFHNMPSAAQHFPEARDIKRERGADLDVCQCTGCGLVQLRNDPVSYYREVIRAAGISPEMKQFRRDQFLQFVQSHSLPGKKILEVGCGRGEYLHILQQCRVEAYGLEFSEDAVKSCCDDGLRVDQGYLDQAGQKLKHAPFDAFMILNFLEHLPDINEVLRGIRHNSREDAVGLVEVPNFDMILQKGLFSEFINDHLYYFTKKTLTYALETNGFEVMKCREIWHSYILAAEVRKRCPLDLAFLKDRQVQLKNNLMQFISRFPGRRVVIWGAGHQALAIIALTDIADHIKYVVDSAPFKQGKYTPATHLPVVAPSCLNRDPVDAVLVMAASYSDEVAAILKKDYRNDLTIAVLRGIELENL